MALALRASLWFALLVVTLGTARASTSDTCVYTVYVRTGSIIKAGTDANISLALGDADGERLIIENVVTWGGLMGEDHDYFERGNLDIFSGRGPCLASPICSVIVSSDGTGSHHGWYCDYVEVTSTGPHVQCQQHSTSSILTNGWPPMRLLISLLLSGMNAAPPLCDSNLG